MPEKGQNKRGQKSQKATDSAEKRALAVKLRTAGHGYEDIAKMVGYGNPGTAFKAVKEGLKQSLRDAGSEDLRAVELKRCDELQASRWAPAVAGDNDAYDRVLKVMKRRAELLGLDAPIRIHDVTPKGYDVINTPEDLYLEVDDGNRDDTQTEVT